MTNNNDCGLIINGNHTDIVIKTYKNRIFIIATQFKKLGSMVAVSREASLNQFNSRTYSTQTLFGKDNEEIDAAARYLAEAIEIDRPLLLSIALRDYEITTLKPIIHAINNLKSW